MSQNEHDEPQRRGPILDARIASPPARSTRPPASSTDRSPLVPPVAYSAFTGTTTDAPVPPRVPFNHRTAVAVFGVAIGVTLLGAWIGGVGQSKPISSPTPVVETHSKTIAVAAVDADLEATKQLKAILANGTVATDGKSKIQLRATNAAGLQQLSKTAPKMAEEIQSGRRVLYRLYLLDFLAEDGDRVELFVDGFSLGETVLRGAGTSFLIPVVAGTPVQLKLLATADGGGGVTVGFMSSVGEARTQVMQVGQFDLWQVVVQ